MLTDPAAFVELQLDSGFFLATARLLCSSAPNPFATFDFLGGQLVTAVVFTGIVGGPDQILPAAAAPPGQVAFTLAVTISSIALDDFIQVPSAAPMTTDATYTVAASIDGLSLRLSVTTVTVAGVDHPLPAPVLLFTRDLSQQLNIEGASAAIVGGAVVYDPVQALVVARWATSPVALSFAAQWPVTDHVRADGDNFTWAIFLSGGGLANVVQIFLAGQLQQQLPSGYSLTKAPNAVWDAVKGAWGVDVGFEIDAQGACPTVFGGVDVHVTINVHVDVSVDVPHQQFVLRAHLTHDTDGWDVAACTLANVFGGLLGIGVSSPGAALGTFLGGFGLAFGAAVLLPGVAYSTVSEQVSGQSVTGFTALPQPDPGDDETLQQRMGIPALPWFNPATDTLDGVVDGSGVAIRATFDSPLPIPGTHQMTVAPNPVTSDWTPHFNCNTHHLDPGTLGYTPVTVADTFTAPGIGSQPTPVVLFSVNEGPLDYWDITAAYDVPAPVQWIGIALPPHVDPVFDTGLAGKLYIHSSAGLAEVDIAPVPPPPAQPTGDVFIEAVAACQLAEPAGPWVAGGLFNIRWLVDPPPWEAAAGVLHEWVVRFDAFGAGTAAELISRSSERTASAAVVGQNRTLTAHFVLPAGDELALAVRGDTDLYGSVGQRLLVRSEMIRVGAPIRAIAPTSGGGVAVLTDRGVVGAAPGRGIVWSRDDLRGSGLTAARSGTYLWGSGGAARLTALGVLPLFRAGVRAAAPDGDRIVFDTVIGPVAAGPAGLEQLTEERDCTCATPTFGAPFLRLGRQVAVALGDELIIARPGRSVIRMPQGESRPRRLR